MPGQVLCTIADAQQGQFPLDGTQINLGRIGVAYRARAAGQDNALYRGIQLRTLIIRIDLTKNIQLPKAAANQLRHLGTKIENNDFF